ncbi:MAG: TRAP transporter large permease [Geminicoccaceae bacterium]|nr:MAG: TRAP transporter large permease [Geminicoccaceae bacterium]
MTVTVLFGSFFLGLLLAMPAALALALACAAAIVVSDRLPGTLLPQQIVATLDSTPLLAIPLFILLGEIVARSSLGLRLVELCQALVGWMRGGLAQANVVASMFFGGISGAATADTAAIGSVMIPAMRRQGYPAAFSAVVTCTSSVMGNLIPPTIDLIIYGWLTGTPIDRLFAAGIVPGLTIGLCLMAMSYLVSRRRGYGERTPFVVREVGRTGLRAVPALVMPVLIIGGIFGGMITVTEAAVVAILYGLGLTVLVYRELGWRDLLPILAGTVRTVGGVMFLIGVAAAFGWILTIERVPQNLSATLLDLYPGPAAFALTVIAVSLFCGLFLTPATALIILTPIFFPLSRSFGYDPIHFGILLISSLALGHVTPPIGLTLFIGASLAKVPVDALLRPLAPFFLALLVAVLLIAFIPALSLTLPGLMR